MKAEELHFVPVCAPFMAYQLICQAQFEPDWGSRWKPEALRSALLQAMMALCNPGDEVLVPAPYWVSYTAIAKICGATPIVISTRESDGYCLMPQDLEAALTPRTRVLVLGPCCW